ncbi:MAG: response regulator [Deltaproteobacteria bacterium]|nr:response regulator [Deltaproteobacteria bacterium]
MHVIKELSVLVVDDSRYGRDQIKRAISDLPFQKVYEADGGFQALTIMRRRPVHLVFSDFRMPKMPGLVFLKILKNDPDISDVPFIMVIEKADTRSNEGNDQKMSQEAGADGILVKPLNPADTCRMAISVLSKTIDRDKENMYVAMDAADAHSKAGQIDVAILEYEKAIQFKDNIPSRIMLGTHYLAKKEHKKAMSNFMGALKQNPNCLEAMLNMGRMFKELGDIPKAVKVLEEGLKRAETISKYPQLQGYTNFYIGRIQLELDHLKLALTSFAKASEAEPTSLGMQIEIGNA